MKVPNNIFSMILLTACSCMNLWINLWTLNEYITNKISITNKCKEFHIQLYKYDTFWICLMYCQCQIEYCYCKTAQCHIIIRSIGVLCKLILHCLPDVNIRILPELKLASILLRTHLTLNQDPHSRHNGKQPRNIITCSSSHNENAVTYDHDKR